jgi:hypothetical protein
MGRGAQAQTQQMIDQQLAQQNAMNQQLYSSSQSLGSQATAGYQNMVANPGYTDAEKSAMTNLSQSALSSSFNALAQNASNRAARTRNSAGYGEMSDSLARTARTRRTSRSKTRSRSATPRVRIRSRDCPGSPASTARTQRF